MSTGKWSTKSFRKRLGLAISRRALAPVPIPARKCNNRGERPAADLLIERLSTGLVQVKRNVRLALVVCLVPTDDV